MPQTSALFSQDTTSDTRAPQGIRILRIEHPFNGLGPIAHIWKKQESETGTSHETFLCALTTYIETFASKTKVLEDLCRTHYDSEEDLRDVAAVLMFLEQPSYTPPCIRPVLPEKAPGTEDMSRALSKDIWTFLDRYPDPADCPGPIGIFFRGEQARIQHRDLFNEATAPWFFGILDSETNVLSHAACIALDSFGFVVRTYVPAPGTFIVEGGQVAFIKDQATCVAETGVEQGLLGAA